MAKDSYTIDVGGTNNALTFTPTTQEDSTEKDLKDVQPNSDDNQADIESKDVDASSEDTQPNSDDNVDTVPKDVDTGDDEENAPLEQDETNTHDDSEELSKANVYKLLAQQMQSQGHLPEDIEVSDDFSYDSLVETIRTTATKGLQEQYQTVFQNYLQQQGYDEDHLLYAKALRQGVDPALLSKAGQYESLAQSPDEADAAKMRRVISAMHQDRGLPEDDINDLLEVKESKDQIKSEYDKAREYFKGKDSEFKEREKERQEQVDKDAQRIRQEQVNNVQRIITDKKLGGFSISDEAANYIKYAYSQPDVVVEVDGQKHQATRHQKFLYDMNNSVELQLWAMLMWENKDQLGKQATDSAKKQVSSELESAILAQQGHKPKTSKKNTNKKTKNKSPKSYMIDLTG